MQRRFTICKKNWGIVEKMVRLLELVEKRILDVYFIPALLFVYI